MHELARKAFEEAVLPHPFVVVDLAEVVPAGIGQDDDHQGLLIELAGDIDRRLHGGTAGAADQDAFFTGDAPSGQKGVAVVDLHDAVDQLQVDGAGDEVFADSLHLVRLDRVAGVEGSLGVGADDHHRRLLFLEITGHAGHGAARAQPADHYVHLPVGLLPDLGTGRLVVRLRVRLVEVLVGLKGAGNLLAQPLRHGVVALGRLAGDGGRADDHLGAVGSQQRNLLG